MMEKERAPDPAGHQPTKAELDEDVSVNATLEALGWAVTRGGAERNDKGKPAVPSESASK